jgi:hypothetical protein
MPTSWYSEDGGHIFPIPVYDDSIIVESEEIRFTNLRYSRPDESIAIDLIISQLFHSSAKMSFDADITYHMLNTGDNAKSVDIVFPIHKIDELGVPQITANSVSIPYRVSDSETDLRPFGFEPRNLSSEVYQPNPYGVFSAIEFSVDFEPRERVELNVKYLQNSGYDGMTKPFFYYLQPAKYWKDFSNLDIYVELPGNYSLKSPLGFAKETKSFLHERTIYYMHSEKLPDSDLEFDVRWERPKVATLIAICAIIALLASITTKFVRRRKRTSRNT